MKKLLTILLVIITLLIISPKNALAANLNINCAGSPSGCSMSGNSPLFSKALDGFWYPGRELTKTINLKNASSDTREMALKATQTLVSDDLKQVMSVVITDSSSTVIWSGSLSDFYSNAGVVMGTFNAEESKDYYFKVTMDSGANNDYQGLQSEFDLALGFWGNVVSSPSNRGGPGDGLGCATHDCSGNSGGGGGAPSGRAVLGISTTPTVLGLAFNPKTGPKVLGTATSSATPTPSVIPTPAGQTLGSSSVNWLLSHITLFPIILLILAILAYFIYRKKRNK